MSSTIVLSLYKTCPSESQQRQDSPDHNTSTTLDKPRSSIDHDTDHNEINKSTQTITLQGQVIEDPSLYYIITQIPLDDGTSSSTPKQTSQEISQTTHHHPDIFQASSQDKVKRRKISTTLIQTPSPLLLSHPETEIVAIGTHIIPRQHVQNFTQTYNAVKHCLADFSLCKGMIGGWRASLLSKDDQSEGESADAEWTLLSFWDRVEDHAAFVGSEGFGEYERIREWVREFGVRHVRIGR